MLQAALAQSLESKCSDAFASTWLCGDGPQSDWWVCLSKEMTDSCGYSELRAMSCVVVHRRTHRRAFEKQQQIIYTDTLRITGKAAGKGSELNFQKRFLSHIAEPGHQGSCSCWPHCCLWKACWKKARTAKQGMFKSHKLQISWQHLSICAFCFRYLERPPWILAGQNPLPFLLLLSLPSLLPYFFPPILSSLLPSSYKALESSRHDVGWWDTRWIWQSPCPQESHHLATENKHKLTCLPRMCTFCANRHTREIFQVQFQPTAIKQISQNYFCFPSAHKCSHYTVAC